MGKLGRTMRAVVALGFALALFGATGCDAANAGASDTGSGPGADVAVGEDVGEAPDAAAPDVAGEDVGEVPDAAAPDGAAPDATTMGAQFLRSEQAREETPAVPPADQQALADGNTAFAFDLYRELRGAKDGNLFCSPLSISVALAMTWAGARGDTADELATALHFTLDQDALHPAFNWLDRELASRDAPPPPEQGGYPFALHVANAIWGQQGYPFLGSFLDVLAVNYGAGMYTLDYGAAPESCRQTINDWVADQTEQRILDLLPPGSITGLTRLVLTNAIYFSASWSEPFEEEDTAPAPFTLLDGSQVTVDTMAQNTLFAWAGGDGFAAVSLPYVGHDLRMIVILPDAGRFAELEGRLDAALLAEIDAGWETRAVDLTLPKFSFDTDFSAKNLLQALGVEQAFTGACDLTGMADTGELYISDVLHKAFVAVDEAGTEAAAATAVIVAGTGMPEVATFHADRPFLFLIQDRPTGTVLFLGRVMDPR
jgi:serpin B